MYKKLLAVSVLSLGLATGAMAQTSPGDGSGGSGVDSNTTSATTDGDDCQSRGEDKTAMNDTSSVAGQPATEGETVVADCED